MAIFGLLVAALVLIVVSALLNGFVLSILWSWFVVPFGMPEIGIAWAIGIALVVGMLTKQDCKSNDQDLATGIGAALGGPLLVLLVGWIVHGFM